MADLGSAWDPQGIAARMSAWDPQGTAYKFANQTPGVTLNSVPRGTGTTGSIAQPGDLTMSPAARDIAIRTIYGEAAGDPASQGAVFQTMLNRVAQGGPGSAGGIQGVAQYPSQYSTWNPPGTPGSNALARNMSPSNPAYPQIGSLVDQIYAGQIPDPTGGSQNYYNPTQANPSWAGPLARRGSVPIGQHLFVGSGPTRISPALTVGGYGDMGAFGA